MGSGRSPPQAVQSYEPDGAAMLLVVEPNEDAVHEAHIGVEVVDGAGSRVKVRANAGEIQISLTDHPAEICDDRRVETRIRKMGIRGRSALDRAGKEKVSTGWCSDVRDGLWNGLALVVLPFIIVVGARHQPQSRAEQESSSGGGACYPTNKVAPTQSLLLKFLP